MDTSKEYIKMCKKAVEIQREWTPKPMDLCIYNRRDERLGCINEIDIITKEGVVPHYRMKVKYFYPIETIDRYDCYFLFSFIPRQDQLQEIYIEYISCKNTSG